MATMLEPPATAALDTTFEVDYPSVLSSSKQSRYIRQRPQRHGHQFVRAASEPSNVSYHPELYDKLNSLWQQTSTLISSQTDQQQSTLPQISSDEMKSQLQPTASIVDSEIFRMVYSNDANLSHFGITKQELPFVETIHNREFLNWVAEKEPGIKVNYDEIRGNLARLSKEQVLRQYSPNVFTFFHNLLRAHDVYILRGARFLSFDLWMTMVQAYYGTPGDVGLLSRFPVTEPAAFEEYIATSAQAMSEESRSNRKRNWSETHDQWQEAERTVLSFKSSKEFCLRYDQLQKLMRIFRNRFEERTKRNRALRTIQANRKVDRKRIIKAANIHAWRESIGQAGLHEADAQQIQLLRDHMDEESRTYNEQHEVDDTVALPSQLEDMKIEDSSQCLGHSNSLTTVHAVE